MYEFIAYNIFSFLTPTVFITWHYGTYCLGCDRQFFNFSYLLFEYVILCYVGYIKRVLAISRLRSTSTLNCYCSLLILLANIPFTCSTKSSQYGAYFNAQHVKVKQILSVRINHTQSNLIESLIVLHAILKYIQDVQKHLQYFKSLYYRPNQDYS